ncbi:Aspartic peptidase, active site [Parasponia andersonii]|uniref:Aspartic peptidase, active site n=1 Tax=Parasponia andersonii TaxID=3476 RepID=A0A2P5AER3_PARAD|nr:Aspartic peptidase, active site [Parasponia andersonii]
MPPVPHSVGVPQQVQLETSQAPPTPLVPPRTSPDSSSSSHKALRKHPSAQPTTNLYARPIPTRRYRFNQPGRRCNKCPQRRQANVADQVPENEVEHFGDVEEDFDGAEIVPGDEGDQVVCIVQKLLLAPKQPQPVQRHVIFRTRYTIKKRVCNVIIDSGSSDNIISKSLVKPLELPTE